MSLSTSNLTKTDCVVLNWWERRRIFFIIVFRKGWVTPVRVTFTLGRLILIIIYFAVKIELWILCITSDLTETKQADNIWCKVDFIIWLNVMIRLVIVMLALHFIYISCRPTWTYKPEWGCVVFSKLTIFFIRLVIVVFALHFLNNISCRPIMTKNTMTIIVISIIYLDSSFVL